MIISENKKQKIVGVFEKYNLNEEQRKEILNCVWMAGSDTKVAHGWPVGKYYTGKKEMPDQKKKKIEEDNLDEYYYYYTDPKTGKTIRKKTTAIDSPLGDVPEPPDVPVMKKGKYLPIQVDPETGEYGTPQPVKIVYKDEEINEIMRRVSIYNKLIESGNGQKILSNEFIKTLDEEERFNNMMREIETGGEEYKDPQGLNRRQRRDLSAQLQATDDTEANAKALKAGEDYLRARDPSYEIKKRAKRSAQQQMDWINQLRKEKGLPPNEPMDETDENKSNEIVDADERINESFRKFCETVKRSKIL